MTHNPYTPPVAEVVDVTSPRPPRPRAVRAAIYAALVVWSLYSAATGEVVQHFARGWLDGALYLLTSLVDAVTLVLLFLPASNAWFGGAWRKQVSPAA